MVLKCLCSYEARDQRDLDSHIRWYDDVQEFRTWQEAIQRANEDAAITGRRHKVKKDSLGVWFVTEIHGIGGK